MASGEDVSQHKDGNSCANGKMEVQIGCTLKNCYPVKVAEYAKANRIHGEPAFAWCVENTLRKRDRILSKLTRLIGVLYISQIETFRSTEEVVFHHGAPTDGT
jgi:hypothetical protein